MAAIRPLPMSNRLLSLLTEIERAMVANDPAPDGGMWDTMRLINYQQGLARLTLAVKTAEDIIKPRGTILLQDFSLADGSKCLKANLSWDGVETTLVYAVYSKPHINWTYEAGRIASKWLDGQPTVIQSGRSLLEAAS